MNKPFKIGIFEAILLVVIFLFLNIFSTPLIFIIKSKPELTPYLYPLAYAIPYVLFILIVKFIWFKSKTEEVDFKFKIPNIQTILISVLFFLGCYFIAEIMVSHLPDENSTVIKQFEQITSIDMKSYFQEMENMFREVYAYFDNYPISAFLTVGIIAPILEELLFRGIILQGLLNKGKSPFLAIFISSLLFGLIHLNPWQLVGAFILGSAIGFVYYRTQSILTAILLHIINNSSVGILYYFYNEESFSEIFNVSNFIILAFGILFIVTFGTLLLKNTKQITLIK